MDTLNVEERKFFRNRIDYLGKVLRLGKFEYASHSTNGIWGFQKRKNSSKSKLFLV